MKFFNNTVLFFIQISLFFISVKGIAQVDGCTDPLANNYTNLANNNDGSCTYDVSAINANNSTQLSATLNENSGLILWNNELWTHNDGGNSTDIYTIDISDLTNSTSLNIPGVSNIDWEEISQDEDYIYIGDFGNNANGNRADLKIYRVEKNSITQGSPIVEVINFTYGDQSISSPTGSNNTDFDCEAFIVTNNNIFLFTKEWVSKETTVYSLPKTPGTHMATNQSSYDVEGLITGATYVKDKQLVVLSGYNIIDVFGQPAPSNPFIYTLYDFQADDFFSGNKRKISISNSFPQVEGVTTNDGLNYFVSNEGGSQSGITIPPEIHNVNLSGFLGNYLGLNGPTNNFATIAEFDNNFNSTRLFTDGAGGNSYRSLTVQATSDTDEYVIYWNDFNDKWINSNTPVNQIITLNHLINDTNSTNGVLENPTTTGNYYTTQIDGFATDDRQAIIMETSNQPIDITNLTFNDDVFFDEEVNITVDLSGSKSPEEKAFIRYTEDGFTNSFLAEVTFSTPTSLTGTATIPSSFNTGGKNVDFYAYSTTVDATPTSNHDLISLSIRNNAGSNFTYTVNSGYITQTGASSWNTPSSWLADAVPPTGVDVIIAHDLSLTDDREVQSIVINSGATLTNSNSTLSIRDNGTVTNNGIFSDNSGTVIFNGNGNISEEIVFNNVVLNNSTTGVSFGTQSTIDGSLTINPGGFVNSNSPIYGSNSTLIYNSANDVSNPYGRRSEWSNAGIQGIPHHVILKNNTTLNMGADNTADDAVITGDLTIETGSAVFMDFANNDMEAPLIVGGDFLNDGAISLSGANGGDLKLFGNFTNNGTFNFNNRALFFEGNEVQNLAAPDNFEIPYLLIDKSGGEVVLYQNISITGDEGTALNMSDQGLLSLNGHQLQIGNNTNTYVEFYGTASLKGSHTSSLLFNSTNTSSGNLRFLSDPNHQDNSLSNFQMNGSGGIAISNTLHIVDRFILTQGTFNTNDVLNFKGSETKTAIIPTVTGGSIIGEIRTERYIPIGNRAFRYLSSPVTSSAYIREQWQEGQHNSNTTSNQNSNAGFGTHITGTEAGSGLGFDATQTGNPSLFIWDNNVTEPDWASILNTNATPLNAGQAYAILVRGDRSVNLNSNQSTGSSTTLRSWGIPITGQHQVNPTLADGEFALIGNPYQAQVDLTLVDKTDFGNFFYIWDPTIGERGGYVAVEIDGSNYEGTTPNVDTAANQFLQVGQAFFIEASAANPTMTFEETHKIDEVDNLETFSLPNHANINLNLYRDGNLLVDGLRIQLAETFADEVNIEDAQKLWNTQEYFAIDKNPSWLMVEKRSIPQDEEILFYLDNYSASNYQFRIQVQQLITNKAYLKDDYLDESYALNNDQENNYSFEVDTSIPESLGPNRFSIYFEEISLSNTLIQESEIKVYPNPTSNGSINLTWPLDTGSETATQISIYTILGKAVFNQEFNQTEPILNLDVSELSTGVYVLKAERGKTQYTTKIIVENRD